MKTLIYLIVSCFVMFSSASSVNAWFFDSFISDGSPDVRYCNWDECGLQQWIDIVKDGITDLETERSASEYIQDIAVYIVWFVSLIAVIYIIYAGFQILVWNGDEEKLKKSKQTILYVIIGIVLIWLAWPITNFIFNILNA